MKKVILIAGLLSIISSPSHSSFFGISEVEARSEAKLDNAGSFTCVASFDHHFPEGAEIGAPIIINNQIVRSIQFDGDIYLKACIQTGMQVKCKTPSHTISFSTIRTTGATGHPEVHPSDWKTTKSYKGRITQDYDIPLFGEDDSLIFCNMKR